MGNYLADRRKELGLTQKFVAEQVGVSEATVSRWESGEIANMRRDKIVLYAKVLKTTPIFIMTGQKEEKTKWEKNPESKFDFSYKDSISFDDFTYALLDESKELTDENKDKLLEMAKFFKMQQDKEKQRKE